MGSQPRHPTPQHVRGHQDDLHRPLTPLESLNCEMDLDAKSFALQHIARGHPPLTFPSSTKGIGTISIRGKLICSKIQTSLYNSVLHYNFVDKLADRFGLDPFRFDDLVNWTAYGKARKSTRFVIKKFISKWISADIPSGKKMKERKHRLHSNCPICDAPDEDLLHILTCPDPLAKEFRSLQLQELRTWLEAELTHPDIKDFLINGLQSWFNQPNGYEPYHHASTPYLSSAFSEQLEISWYAILCGYITNSISTQQHLYFQSLNSRKSGNRWTVKIIHKLWQVIHNIWKFRNDSLHKDNTISQLSGLEHLKQAIQLEHIQGQENLPPVYRSYFRTPIESLLTQSTTHLRQWFLLVRSGRECYDTEPPIDVFYTNPVLRTWIGLSAIDTG